MNINDRIWRKLRYFTCVFCLLFLSSCQTETNNSQWITIEHEQYNFALDYPTKWVAELYGDAGRKGVDEEKLVIMRPPTFGLHSSPSTFIIIVEWRAFDNPSLEDALTWGNERLDSNPSQEGLQPKPGYHELLLQEENISGYEAIRRRYTVFFMDGLIEEEVYIPRERDMITISMRIDEEYFDSFYSDFQRIVNSFKTTP